MRKTYLFLLFCLLACFCYAEQPLSITVSNPTGEAWLEAPCVVPFTKEMAGMGAQDLVLQGTEILPVQLDDLNKDGKPDEMVFLASLGPGDVKQYHLVKNTYGFHSPGRAHTGMYVKGFEGPGWESDRLGFRLYWDERNAIDLFCKRTPVLGLKQYATPGVNYHMDTAWGMDVLKVGTALGAGGFGVWIDGKVEKAAKAQRDYEVIADGPLRAIIDLKYTDWIVGERKLNLLARISMFAGQKWANMELWLTPLDGAPAPEFVTGVVKHEDTTLIQDKDAGILGRWGLQALAPGEKPKGSHLGFGIAANPSQIVAFGEDAVNSFVRLKGASPPFSPGAEKEKQVYVSYKVHASWIHEPGGASSSEAYELMLRSLARQKPEIKTGEK